MIDSYEQLTIDDLMEEENEEELEEINECEEG